jgi:hypothetical protein
MQRFLLFFLTAAFFFLGANAQEKKYLAGIGASTILDTYLTPEHYSGAEIRFYFEKTKPFRRDSLLSYSLIPQLHLSYTEPRSNNAYDFAGLLEFSYGIQYRVFTARKIKIDAGADANIFIGGIYNDRNGNNPAQLKTGLELAPTIKAAYGFHLLKKDMTLKYKIRMPIAGLQFSPAYGQSYYEIFTQGNYDHNICFTSPVNAATVWQMLTVDIPLKKKALTLGYLGDYRQAKLNNLKFHNFSHLFIIGISL